MVEFALVFPVLVLLVLGIFTGGLAYNQKLQLTHSVREGARYGARVPKTQTFASGTWATNVRDLIIERAAGDLTGPGVTVCVSLVQGSPATVVAPAASFTTNGTAPCAAGETYPTTATDNGRRVQVRVSRPGTIELGVFPPVNFTITAAATAGAEDRSA